MTADLITLSNDHLAVEVAPLGAEIQSLRTPAGEDLLWNGDPAVWSGRAPVLFPIVGRAPDDRIAVGAFEAEMKQHGFARRMHFTLIEQTATGCSWRLRDSAETRAAYPFAFALTLTYRLEGPALTVTAEVQNLGADSMPFGLGFHPAFRWPLPGAKGKPHRIALANGAEPQMARLNHSLLPQDRHPSPFEQGRLTLAPEQFEEDAMIFPTGAGNALRYGPDQGPHLAFRFDNLPNLALWTKPGAPFLCIEPWHGMAASLGGSPQIAERPFSLILPPDQGARFAYTVEWQP